VLAVLACGPEPEPQASLEGRTFLSQSVTEDGAPRQLVAGTELRLEFFEGARISASAGCNLLDGTYAIEGDVLVLSDAAQTAIGCDPALSEQDDWYFGYLASSPAFELDDDTIVLEGSGVRIEYLDQEVATPDAELVGPTWTVDTVAPPVPVLTTRPDDPNGTAISTFAWTEAETGVTFQCSIENGPYGPCNSPFTFEVIVDTSNNGEHQFAVRAIDAVGNASSPAIYKWKVNSVGFTITGNADGLLSPGTPRRLVLTLHNPNSFTIYVTAIQVTVDSAPPGCPATNVDVIPSDIDATVAKRVAVPANGTASVPTARRPQILLKNLPTNQDSCMTKTFSLRYTGIATK